MENETIQMMMDKFKQMHPEMTAGIIEYYPSGQFEMTIRMADGSKLSYDYIEDTYRYLKNTVSDELSKDEWLDKFAHKFSRKISLCGMTRKELSEATGITETSLSSYANGKTIPSLYNIEKVARAIGCPISELTYFE